MLTVEKPYKGVILIKGETQYELASAFMRLQEFYESPLSGIRGRYFTLEQYMDKYADEYGNFTYTSDWSGFNVPSDVVHKFFDELFAEGILLEKEKKLRDLIYGSVDVTKKFYVIGTYSEGAVLNHELSHAFYFLDSNYQTAAYEFLSNFPPDLIVNARDHLLEKGYHESVIDDETFAYLATSSMIELSKIFDIDSLIDTLPWQDIFEMQKYAYEFRKARKEE